MLRGRRASTTLLLLLSLMAVGALTGCGGASDEADAAVDDDGAPATDAPADPDEDAPAERDLSADPRDADATSGSGGSGGTGFVTGGLVDDFPEAVPLTPDARIVSSYDPSWEDAGQWGLATTTDLTLAEAQGHFAEALTAAGWQIVENDLTEVFLRMEATGHGYTLNLLAAEDDGRTRLDVLLRPVGS